MIFASANFGCDVWPTISRDWKTVPTGSPPPIFSAMRCRPSGVRLEPSICPMPKRDVEHGNFFTKVPSANSESVCAATFTVKIYLVGATPSFWQVARHAAGKVGWFME